MNAPFDLDALERAALAATPQGIDTAQVVHDCEGDYCNFDGAAIGVQFYGIGNEFGAAERYYRAANPAAILKLIRRLREVEQVEALSAIAEHMRGAAGTLGGAE